MVSFLMNAGTTEEKVQRSTGDEKSPLWMVTRKPHLNHFVTSLEGLKEELEHNTSGKHRLQFSLCRLIVVKQEFGEMIREGEAALHDLCHLLSSSLLKNFETQSAVLAEIPSTGHRFTLIQPITREQLSEATDLDIGTQLLRSFKYFNGTSWETPVLVSNVTEYHSVQLNDFGIHRLVSRVKAEEEIWNKVVDELFQLDQLIKRDKKLIHLSRFVKDVFGVKLVVGSDEEARVLHETFKSVVSDGVPLSEGSPVASELMTKLKFLETKEYLGSEAKLSGWQAIKSVVRWGNATIEMQIQSLANFLSEKQRLTRESHQGFKARREMLRDQIAEQLPLFGFYRALLKWLFVQTSVNSERFVYPSLPEIEVTLTD